jgi:hypothetical protein
MARWYASFDNSTVSGREAAASDGYYERVAISNGSTLKSALIATRAALSSAAYAVINAGNRDGALGIVVPNDVVTRGGGNYAWSNLYTNTGAVWPSDPRVRPTAPIVAAGSIAVSPTDAGTITESLYTDAQTALENCFTAMTGGGPRGRIGLDPYRTLASIFHDHALTYLAWDDFTPGQVQGLLAAGFGTAPNYSVAVTWTSYQYTNDENPDGRVRVVASLGSTTGGNNYSFNSGLIVPPAPAGGVLWEPTVTADTYELVATVYVYDAVISAHEGVFATFQTTVIVS